MGRFETSRLIAPLSAEAIGVAGGLVGLGLLRVHSLSYVQCLDLRDPDDLSEPPSCGGYIPVESSPDMRAAQQRCPKCGRLTDIKDRDVEHVTSFTPVVDAVRA